MTLGGGTPDPGGGTPFRLNLTTERSLSKVKIIHFGTINSSYTTHICCQNVNSNFFALGRAIQSQYITSQTTDRRRQHSPPAPPLVDMQDSRCQFHPLVCHNKNTQNC